MIIIVANHTETLSFTHTAEHSVVNHWYQKWSTDKKCVKKRRVSNAYHNTPTHSRDIQHLRNLLIANFPSTPFPH